MIHAATRVDPASIAAEALGLDLSQYRTDALKRSVEQVLSLADNVSFAIRMIWRGWAIGLVAFVVLAGLSSLWWGLLAFMYGAVAFIPLAVALAVFLTQRRLLNNVARVVDILFETCEIAARDLSALRDQSVTALVAKLVAETNRAVLSPVIDGILTARFGRLARPVVAMYRRTLTTLFDRIEAALVSQPDAAPEAVDETDGVATALASARSTALNVAGTVRGVALLPTGLVLGAVTTVALLLPYLIWRL